LNNSNGSSSSNNGWNNKKKIHTYRRLKAQRKERKKDKTGQNKPDDMEEI
jgi:hypothetical protein